MDRESALRHSYLEACDNEGNTALHVAASSAMMRLLVENGARCDARNKAGQTPLHVLCIPGLVEEEERRRQARAWRHQEQLASASGGSDGGGARGGGSSGGSFSGIMARADAAAHADAEDEEARSKAAAEVIQLFRSHDVDINAQTRGMGDTALHLAIARAGETATSAAAIAALASTERRTMDGATLEASSEACALAAEAEALAVALIGEGAALHIRNAQRLSPLDRAQVADEEATRASGDFTHDNARHADAALEASVVNAQQRSLSPAIGAADAAMAAQIESSARSQGLVVSVLRHVSHAPRWQPDNDVQFCESCPCLGRTKHAKHAPSGVEFPATARFIEQHAAAAGAKFTATRRKHHCRHCGRVVCGPCSRVKMALPKVRCSPIIKPVVAAAPRPRSLSRQRSASLTPCRFAPLVMLPD